VRELSVHPDRCNEIVGSALALKVAGGTVAYALVIALSAAGKWTRPDALPLIAIVGLSLVLQSSDVIDFWFQSRSEARYIAATRSLASAVAGVVKGFLLLSQANLIAFAWVVAVEAAVVAAGLIGAYKLTGNSFSVLRLSGRRVNDLLSESWPLALSGLFVLLTMQLDKVLLGQLADDFAVGVYSVASQVSSVWYMVPIIVGMSVAPSIARAFATGDPLYRQRLQTVYTALTRLAVTISLVVSIGAPLAVRLLFGPEYESAATVLAVHVWTGVFIFHVSIRSRALVAEGRQRAVTAMAFMTLVSNVALNLVLIERYGPLGAATAALASWGLCALVFPAFFRQTKGSLKMFLRSFKLGTVK
jgi:PST family polysaccharide transporter